jgi:hypothetical protein
MILVEAFQSCWGTATGPLERERIMPLVVTSFGFLLAKTPGNSRSYTTYRTYICFKNCFAFDQNICIVAYRRQVPDTTTRSPGVQALPIRKEPILSLAVLPSNWRFPWLS